MTDEAPTPPADTQAPTSEPAPAPEPETTAASTETAQPEATPSLEATQTKSTPEAPFGAVEAPRASENLEAVIDTIPQNTPVAPEPQTAQTVPAQPFTTVIRPHGDIAKARAKIQETKHKKLEKIMAKLTEKGRITNDEVEKLLHISDATATRYLSALEKENRIRQTGKTGSAVFYEKI